MSKKNKNMKKLLTLLLIVTSTIVYSKTILVKDPGNYNNIQPYVQMSVDSAIDGDIVSIPYGTFLFNKSITTTKKISVIGAGLTQTILYRSETTSDATLQGSTYECFFKFNINSTVPSNIIISGICFKSKKPCINTGDGGSLAADFGIEMNYCKDFKITRCRFENFGNGAIQIYHDDSIVGGLISNNEFYHNEKGPDGLGLGYGVVIYGDNKRWTTDPEFGSSRFIFIENNIFEYHRHSIAAGGNAKYVFRYNTIWNNYIISTPYVHAVDAHNGRGGTPGTSNYYGTRAVEVYNNNITNTTFYDGSTIIPSQNVSKLVEVCISINSGDGLIYKNTINGYRFGMGMQLFKPGTGKIYYWGNNFTVYGANCQDFYNYQPTVLKEGVDFFLAEKAYTIYQYPHPLNGAPLPPPPPCPFPPCPGQ